MSWRTEVPIGIFRPEFAGKDQEIVTGGEFTVSKHCGPGSTVVDWLDDSRIPRLSRAMRKKLKTFADLQEFQEYEELREHHSSCALAGAGGAR